MAAHTKCRATGVPYLRSDPPVFRSAVPDDKLAWSSPFADYAPPEYNDPVLRAAFYADPDAAEPAFKPRWNAVDGSVDRRSFVGDYRVADGRPLNPLGRTGLAGRGILGKWGPNHAADPIVTRWKRQPANGDKVQYGASKLPILQFVAILRGDVHQWAIPGGMVDVGELVTATLRREFGEEAFNTLQMSEERRRALSQATDELFGGGGTQVYRGYVDDPRNTDNAWMETVAVNFHDDSGRVFGAVDLQAGSDAVGVHWMDIGGCLQLYASHLQFLETVAKLHNAHW